MIAGVQINDIPPLLSKSGKMGENGTAARWKDVSILPLLLMSLSVKLSLGYITTVGFFPQPTSNVILLSNGEHGGKG